MCDACTPDSGDAAATSDTDGGDAAATSDTDGGDAVATSHGIKI